MNNPKRVRVTGAPGYRNFTGEVLGDPITPPWTGKTYVAVGYYDDEGGWEVDIFLSSHVTYVTD